MSVLMMVALICVWRLELHMDNSVIVAIVDGGCNHLMLWLELRMVSL